MKASKSLSQTQYIALGFFIMILIGTLLLMLPIASKDGTITDPLSAAFTATSASCVTGLVAYDTYTHWSLFGQLVLICLIQIGGLGFITIGLLFSIMFRQRIGLRTRNRMMESVNALQVGGIITLAKKILIGTFSIELIGGLLLSLRFIPEFGFIRGLYYGIFHSVSAFCNAGFDLMGINEPYSSFVAYRDDVFVNIVLVLLILLGGLGFSVWSDIWTNKTAFRQYKLHTKLVLIGTLIFTVGGTLLFFIFEYNNLLAQVGWAGKFSASLFGAVTPRTAGFNTTATENLSESGQLLTLFLMLVGGNSGSTAGGVKVTTIMVLYMFVASNFTQSSNVEIYGKRLSEATVRKAAAVFTINMTLGVAAAMIICALQHLDLKDVLFETFSAINTVGMTRGITRDLCPASKIIIMMLMYFGRVGSLTFAFSLLKKKDTDIIKCPVEEISVG